MLVSVTGARGFLGGHTVAALHREGHRVRALVRAPDPKGASHPAVDEWCVGDLSDPQAATRLVAGAGAIVHIAMDWAALQDGPIPSAERNLLGTLRPLEQARLANVQQFVFVSTLEVYHERLEHRPIDEKHPAWPGSLYGAFKAAVEIHLKGYHAAYGMNTSAWRPAAMYGVNPRLERSLMFDVVRKAEQGQPVSAPGSGDVVWVQDVADALALAIGHPSVAGELYNLSDLNLRWEVFGEIAREPGGWAAAALERASGPVFDSRKAIAFFDRHANSAALRRGLEGVRRYVGDLRAVGFGESADGASHSTP